MYKRISFLLLVLGLVFLSAGCSGKLFGTPRDGTSTKVYDKAKSSLDKANGLTEQRTQENLLNVTQTVEGSNLNDPNGYKIAEGKTALELLKQTHQVQSKNYQSMGEFVESIDGTKPDSKHFWAFYVNGKTSDVGASSYTLKDGDQIQWKLEEIK